VRALCAALLLALPAHAGAPLTPSPELAAKLKELEARRAPIEAQRALAFRLRFSAWVGYGLALVCAGWTVAELAASAKKSATPLGGAPHRTVVPAGYVALAGLALAVAAVVLHVGARVLDHDADHQAEDLAEEERELEWKYRRPETDAIDGIGFGGDGG
jgi:hypothetical protein